jgi:hypothetical protein
LVNNERTKADRPDLASEYHIVMPGLGSMDNTIENVLLLPPQMLCPRAVLNVNFTNGVPVFQ